MLNFKFRFCIYINIESIFQSCNALSSISVDLFSSIKLKNGSLSLSVLVKLVITWLALICNVQRNNFSFVDNMKIIGEK